MTDEKNAVLSLRHCHDEANRIVYREEEPTAQPRDDGWEVSMSVLTMSATKGPGGYVRSEFSGGTAKQALLLFRVHNECKATTITAAEYERLSAKYARAHSRTTERR